MYSTTVCNTTIHECTKNKTKEGTMNEHRTPKAKASSSARQAGVRRVRSTASSRIARHDHVRALRIIAHRRRGRRQRLRLGFRRGENLRASRVSRAHLARVRLILLLVILGARVERHRRERAREKPEGRLERLSTRFRVALARGRARDDACSRAPHGTAATRSRASRAAVSSRASAVSSPRSRR